MPDKTAPIGVCDHCGGPIPAAQWYTSKRTARLHCSLECKQTANARAGAPVISRKNRERIASGEWRNPMTIRPPTSAEQAARARKARLREVAEGRWRNPALSDAARAKLSRPRKYSGDLAAAIEKLKAGQSVADLTEIERNAYRGYRRRLYWRDPERSRRAYRRQYRRRVERNQNP